MSEFLMVPYLTVESLEPEMIMLLSYCKHNTEPVCPVNTCTHSNVFLSHICKFKNADLWISSKINQHYTVSNKDSVK